MAVERNILLVDDNPADMALLEEHILSIRDNHNYRIFKANNGEEAVKIYAKYPIDCALIDFYMTSENGVQVQRMLTNFPSHRESHSKLPVVIVSQASDAEGLPIDKETKESIAFCSKQDLTKVEHIQTLIDSVTPH